MSKKIDKQEALESIIENNLFSQSFMIELVGEDPEYDLDSDIAMDTDDARNPIKKTQILVEIKADQNAIDKIEKDYAYYVSTIKSWAKGYDTDSYFDSILTTDNSITFVFDVPSEDDKWQPEQYLENEQVNENARDIDKAANGKSVKNKNELALEAYPRLINDEYNPLDDDNEEYRNAWIKGYDSRQPEIDKLKGGILLVIESGDVVSWNKSSGAFHVIGTHEGSATISEINADPDRDYKGSHKAEISDLKLIQKGAGNISKLENDGILPNEGFYEQSTIDAIKSYDDGSSDLKFIQPKDVIAAAEKNEVYAFDLRDGSDFMISERSPEDILKIMESGNFAFFVESDIDKIETYTYDNAELLISDYKKALEEALYEKYSVNIKDTGFDDTHIKLALDKKQSIDDIVDFIGKEYKLTPVSLNKENKSSSKGVKSYLCVIKDKSGKELGSYPVSYTDDKYLDEFLKAIGVKLRASDTREIVQIIEK